MRENYQSQMLSPEMKIVRLRKRLIDKYSFQILLDFQAIFTRDHWTLTKIAKIYGFSRERARQLFNIFYKDAIYQDIQTAKNDELNRIVSEAKRKLQYRASFYKGCAGIGAKVEKNFYDICQSMNFAIKKPKSNTIDFIVNGYTVEVKSRKNPVKLSPHGITKYYNFTLKEKQKEVADFIACYPFGWECFFIIPIKEINSLSIFIGDRISSYRTSKNSYQEYKEAWHLLR